MIQIRGHDSKRGKMGERKEKDSIHLFISVNAL